MKKITKMSLVFLSVVGLTTSVATGVVLAGESDLCYEVTITNMTRGQVLTPVLVATHKKGVKLFTEGEPASEELEYLAENGMTDPLTGMLEARPHEVGTVAVAAFDRPGGVFLPGESVTIEVPASGRYNRMSLASMLAITNDGFVALNGVPARPGIYVSPVYDAGTEVNDELADHIPGPGGEGFNPEDGEGFVHIHAGFHGIGDLPEEELDWRNPAAKITVTRLHCSAE